MCLGIVNICVSMPRSFIRYAVANIVNLLLFPSYTYKKSLHYIFSL